MPPLANCCLGKEEGGVEKEEWERGVEDWENPGEDICVLMLVAGSGGGEAWPPLWAENMFLETLLFTGDI